MQNEFEQSFGQALHQVVTHLIKNAARVPAPALQAALDVEKNEWRRLPQAEKADRLRAVAQATEEPSDVFAHFDAYPHKMSKDTYAKYLAALKLYKESMGL
jgi:acyl-CoA reductase-like NAD-dependent aldehyde dehydrogenase